MTATVGARWTRTRWGSWLPGSVSLLSRTGRAAALFVSVGSLILAVPGAASAARIDEHADYADYHHDGVAARQDGDAPAPINVDSAPVRAVKAEPLPLDGEQFGVASLDLVSSAVMLSQGSPDPVARQVREAADITVSNFNSFLCGYPTTSVQASPAPPASGNQYAMARTGGLWGYAQARDAQSGFFQEPHSSTAYISFNVAIDIPIDWPQPSQINAYTNPFFEGGHYVESNFSPLTFSASSASTQELIEFGWSRDSQEFMQTLWDIRTSKSDGTEELVFYHWHGLDEGYYFRTNIDSTPAHVYTFSVRTRTTATSSPVFGASAAAQIDYGSGGLDAPSLAPLLLFHANNRHQEFFWIEYLLPPDWEIASC